MTVHLHCASVGKYTVSSHQKMKGQQFEWRHGQNRCIFSDYKWNL